jgi:hypothetical protein
MNNKIRAYVHGNATPIIEMALPLPLDMTALDFHSDDSKVRFSMVLDSISLAAHDGQLTKERWVEQCFVDRESFVKFLHELKSYDFFLHSYWFFALLALAGRLDSEELDTNESLAAALLESANDAREHVKNSGSSRKKGTVVKPLKLFKPIKSDLKLPVMWRDGDEQDVEDVINAISEAILKRKVSNDTWLSQLFADADSFENFLSALENYEYHLTSNQFYPLLALTYDDEGACLSNHELAEQIGMYAEEMDEFEEFSSTHEDEAH